MRQKHKHEDTGVSVVWVFLITFLAYFYVYSEHLHPVQKMEEKNELQRIPASVPSGGVCRSNTVQH